MSTVKNLIERLQRDYEPEEEIATILWTREDVYGALLGNYKEENLVNEKGNPLTDEAKEIADDVLSCMDDHADCEYGMTWETLYQTLDEHMNNRKKERTEQ